MDQTPNSTAGGVETTEDERPPSLSRQVRDRVTGLANGFWEDLKKNYLWQRILRNTLATTLTIGCCLINYNTNPPFGRSAYLATMLTAFAHPGRRVGQLIEALTLSLAGGFVGIGFSLLGLHLSNLLMDRNESAAYTIRGIFFAIALMIHGFYRSHTPRMFLFVLMFIIEVVSAMVTSSKEITGNFVGQLAYPILLAGAIVLGVNICVFPEFSSAFIGTTTINALEIVSTSLENAGGYFVESQEEVQHKHSDGVSRTRSQSTTKKLQSRGCLKLADVTDSKTKVRSALDACRSAQNESQFEIAYAHIPPHTLSPISKTAMKRLTAHAIAVIGTCETRFALLGDPLVKADSQKMSTLTKENSSDSSSSDGPAVDLELLKPHREIEFGDVKLLRYLLSKIKSPYLDFQGTLIRAMNVVSTCVAYAYDIPRLNSGAATPKGIPLEELDIHLTTLKFALQKFDQGTTEALEGIITIQELKQEELDIMPREEIFLVASFLLNVRQVAVQIYEMLEHCKVLVAKRSQHTGFKRVYIPNIKWQKWLYSGGEEDESLPARGRQSHAQAKAHRAKQGKKDSSKETALLSKQKSDIETGNAEGLRQRQSHRTQTSPDSNVSDSPNEKEELPAAKPQTKKPFIARLRFQLADILEWAQHSEDLSYAFKLTVATYLVSFPAVVPSLNGFYNRYRGTWAALQLIFVFDVAIGTCANSFFLRLIGTTLGCLWGWAAFSAGSGNPFVCTAMLFAGLLPSTYVQLATPYPKAGMVCNISMCVVALATELQMQAESAAENFLKRWIEFLIGGVVALLVEVILLPVKARTRMVGALAQAVKRTAEMEDYVAFGIEDRAALADGFPPHVFQGFDRASGKAKAALGNAETFLPFCSAEPRLKASFSEVEGVYREIIFVLRQVVDKMDNMLQLRLAYGSGPLEELNELIFAYRRNVAGAITCVLYAVHEALTTKYPLPQFLPSARLAHLRLINKVRDVVQSSAAGTEGASSEGDIARTALKRTLRHKYLSWQASSAAQAEIIEYLEELSDLTKLLVGSSEFRTGMLTRPTFQRYASRHNGLFEGEADVDAEVGEEMKETVSQLQMGPGPTQRERRPTKVSVDSAEIPISLQRISSRKQEAGLMKRRTNLGKE